MKNTFLKYFSYITPIIVTRGESVFHDSLEIQWVNGTKVLNSKYANYSFGSLHRVFQYAFSHFNVILNNNKEVLILGFGAGSVKSLLRKELAFQGKIVGVELDEKIINLAKSHFNLPNNTSQFALNNDDAYRFMTKNKAEYHLIIVDIFYELTVPKSFLKVEFILYLKQALSPNGQILFNVIGTQNLTILTKSLLENQLKYELTTIEIYGTKNYLLLISK